MFVVRLKLIDFILNKSKKHTKLHFKSAFILYSVLRTPFFLTVFKTFLRNKEKIVNALQLPYPIQTPNWKRLIISLNSSNEMPLVFETLKTSKNGFLSL